MHFQIVKERLSGILKQAVLIKVMVAWKVEFFILFRWKKKDIIQI